MPANCPGNRTRMARRSQHQRGQRKAVPGCISRSVATAPNWACASLTNSRATEAGALWPGVSRRVGARQAASGTCSSLHALRRVYEVKGVQVPPWKPVDRRAPPT